MDMNLSKLQEMVKDREALHAAVREVAKSPPWFSNQTTKVLLKHKVLTIIELMHLLPEVQIRRPPRELP